VLLTTFSRPLANALQPKLAILLSGDRAALDRVTVASFDDTASELFQLTTGRRASIATDDAQQSLIEAQMKTVGFTGLPLRFVVSEWRHVVDGWGIASLTDYADVPRIGRRNRLGTRQREILWPIFEAVRSALSARGMVTVPQMFAAVEREYASKVAKPFTHIIVDEAQDLGVAQLRMLAALASGANALFFAGDLGQRIFQQPFSWKALGVDVRGRSAMLRINYRTSRQIREAADHLLPPTVRDVDGLEDDRRGAQSVFEGPAPVVALCTDQDAEAEAVAAFLRTASEDGIAASEMGLFVRSAELLSRARTAVAAAGLEARQLTERAEDFGECVSIGTMHLAKGLEFKAVAVMACDDEALPLQSRVDDATDEDELREVFETERHLFYVACTRARDRLHISGIKPVSEFLGDIRVSRE
jgi:superfamily I DNA/RNA helicase